MTRHQLDIRTYRNSDREDVINLWNKCGLTSPGNDPEKDISLKADYQNELFFIGICNSIIAATLMAGYDGHRGWFNYFGVLPEFQGKGLGREMADHAVQVLKKIGCPKINLQVRNTNLQVIGFYREIGFHDHEVTSLQMKLHE